jgi:hypothetical protein
MKDWGLRIEESWAGRSSPPSSILNPSSSIRWQAHPLLPQPLVTRRILALFGFFLVLALAVTLLYRVYIHHIEAEPYEEEESAVVQLEVKIASSSR